MRHRSQNNVPFSLQFTGIFLVVTPDYLIDRKAFPYPSGLVGEIFCRLVGSTYILFIFGKASTSTIMCLAIDRWYSTVRPIRYKTAFSKRRLFIYVAVIWTSAAITQVNELFISSMSDGYCKFITPPYGKNMERILIVLHVSVTFYIPSMVTWLTFGHIWQHIRKPTVRRHINNNETTKRLLRMCAMAALSLNLSWLPTETFFILYKFEILKLPFEFYLFTSVLAMANSCVNPWIYCLSNREYRREFVRLMHCIKRNTVNPITNKILSLLPSRRPRYSISQAVSSSTDNVTNGTHVLTLHKLIRHSSFSTHATSIYD